MFVHPLSIIVVACVGICHTDASARNLSECLELESVISVTYPALTGAFEMAMLSGVRALTYDSVIAKYCGESSSSSMVIGAGGGECDIVTRNGR